MANSNSMPTICIVGRPNVGKSALFNCLVGERRAVVVEQYGTTRDRLEVLMKLGNVNVKLVDTGGFLSGDTDDMSVKVKNQIYKAVEEATVLVMVADIMDGPMPSDKEVALVLRTYGKPVVLVANKADNESLANDAVEFYQLGFGEPLCVSCAHKIGIENLRDRLTETVKGLACGDEEASPEEGKKCIRIAIVGRPNVGKSSFVNNMLDQDRVIVADEPGTTRDSIDTNFTYGGDDYVLVDTAGIRHRNKIKTPVDSYSMMRSKETIERADIVFVLIDAADGVTKDDLSILKFVEENGKGCAILVNKWDLAAGADGNVTFDDYKKHILYAHAKVGRFPIMEVSAKTGKNVLGTLAVAKVLDANLDLKVTTPFLNKIFDKHDPSRIPIPRSKKRPNFMYAVQAGTRPVVFKFFVNEPRAVLSVHMSFIENQLRSNLPLSGIPIKIIISRSRKE